MSVGTGFSSHGGRQRRMCCSAWTRSFLRRGRPSGPYALPRRMTWVRVRLVRRSWLCRNTSSRCPATSGGTRKTLTTEPSGTPSGRTKVDSEARSRVIRAHALWHGEGPCMVKTPPMDILFVATELWPYVKVGGLADVTASLTKALRGLGHKVTLVLPRFPELEASGLLVARRLTPLRFSLDRTTERMLDVTVYDGRLASQVDLVLVDLVEHGKSLFDRPGSTASAARTTPTTPTGSPCSRGPLRSSRSSAQRRAPRSTSSTATTGRRRSSPTYLRVLRADFPALAATHTVLTIHNLVAPGGVPEGAPAKARARLGGVRHRRGSSSTAALNVLKHGILTADAVTTVSDDLRARHPDAGARHEARRRPPDAQHGPRGDPERRGLRGVEPRDRRRPGRALRRARTPRTRPAVKGALQKELGLPIDAHVPLIANVGRIVEQKGSDLIARALPKLLRATDAQFVVAGDGDAALVQKIERRRGKAARPRRVRPRGASEPLAHRIFAAADIVLVPSRFEPCGLVQMYAQRYGALPVARRDGRARRHGGRLRREARDRDRLPLRRDDRGRAPRRDGARDRARASRRAGRRSSGA